MRTGAFPADSDRYGVALHAGGLPGYPESHGCVHLSDGFSRDLFGITALGATVVIDGNAADHVRMRNPACSPRSAARGGGSNRRSLAASSSGELRIALPPGRSRSSSRSPRVRSW
nr:L,D-transpeptidase family protein [Sphingomonas sp. OK281]